MLTTVLLIAASTCTQVMTSQDTTPTRETLEQVVVIGASLSDGFGLSLELDTRVDLADVLSLAVGKDPGEIHCLGDSLFSRSPIETGENQVQEALSLNPTLVIAADFAFWFGYGLSSTCEGRLEQLEVCLKQLERLKCPVLVGDFPDMTRALRGKSPLLGGKSLILPQQIPAKTCLPRLNARLTEWANSRDNVTLWPMSRFVAALESEGTLDVRGNRYEGAQKQALMQKDLLHPSSQGAVVVSLSILDTLNQVGWIEEARATWDAKVLHEHLMQSTRAARERAVEKRRQREERRKQRAAYAPSSRDRGWLADPPPECRRWSA